MFHVDLYPSRLGTLAMRSAAALHSVSSLRRCVAEALAQRWSVIHIICICTVTMIYKSILCILGRSWMHYVYVYIYIYICSILYILWIVSTNVYTSFQFIPEEIWRWMQARVAALSHPQWAGSKTLSPTQKSIFFNISNIIIFVDLEWFLLIWRCPKMGGGICHPCFWFFFCITKDPGIWETPMTMETTHIGIVHHTIIPY